MLVSRPHEVHSTILQHLKDVCLSCMKLSERSAPRAWRVLGIFFLPAYLPFSPLLPFSRFVQLPLISPHRGFSLRRPGLPSKESWQTDGQVDRPGMTSVSRVQLGRDHTAGVAAAVRCRCLSARRLSRRRLCVTGDQGQLE